MVALLFVLGVHSVAPAFSTMAPYGASGIAADTTWTAAQSPIVLDGVVVVQQGVMLTIEPGVRVRARPGSRLEVRGVLEAAGTPLDPITFESKSGRRDWGGIRFVGTGGIHRRDDRSRLVHATVSDATKGVAATYDSPRLDSLTFRSNSVGVSLMMPVADVLISNSRFFRNTVAVKGRSASRVTIEHSDFWANARSVVAGPKRAYDCVVDDGAWLLRANDLLRGPSQGWHSRDVATAPGSYSSTFTVDATLNHWGALTDDDVQGRLFDAVDNSFSLTDGLRKRIAFEPFSVAPLTPWMPPGEVASPSRQPSTHPDPPTLTRVVRPVQGRCYAANDSPRHISGETRAPAGTARWVRVAVRRRTNNGCAWMTDETPRFVAGSCKQPVWLRPSGLSHWTLSLRASLPAGRYVTYSRSNDDGHALELGRNKIQFRVRSPH